MFTPSYSFEYFSGINSKTNLIFEKSFKFVCRTRRDKSIDVCITSKIYDKKKSRYSFEDRGTDGQTESIWECTLKDLSNDI